MPSLQKLVVSHGYFRLSTAQLFPPVRTLEIHGNLDPSADDKFSEEQIAALRNLTLGKIPSSSDKATFILKQLGEAGSQLESLSIHLSQPNPKRTFEIIVAELPKLQTFKATGLQTELQGLNYLQSFQEIRCDLKTLDLSFARLREQEIQTNAKNCTFIAGSNQSVTDLTLSFTSAGKPSSIANDQWIDFLKVFSGLHQLTIKNISMAADPEFWSKVLSSMPNLRSLKLPGCILSKENYQNLFMCLSSELCKVCDLEIDYNPNA